MLTRDQLRTLFEYNLWANARILGASEALTAEQFTRPLGSSFGSVRDTLAHLHGAGWLWDERFKGRRPATLPPASRFASLSEVRAALSAMDRYYLEMVAAMPTEELARVIDYVNLTGEACTDPVWLVLHQLSNHATYHRGQVATLLRQLGAPGVSTDLIRFYHARQAEDRR